MMGLIPRAESVPGMQSLSRGSTADEMKGFSPRVLVVETIHDPLDADSGPMTDTDRQRRLRTLLQQHTALLEQEMGDRQEEMLEEEKGESQEGRTVRRKQIQLLASLKASLPSSVKDNMVGTVPTFFGVPVAEWQNVQLSKKMNLSVWIPPLQMRVLELLKMRYYAAGGDRIIAWISFRPSKEDLAKGNIQAGQDSVIGLVGVSATGANSDSPPVGIAGLWVAEEQRSVILCFSIIRTLRAGISVNVDNSIKLPSQTMRLFQSVQLCQSFERILDDYPISALPTLLSGVQLQSPDDPIVATFSVEKDNSNVFRSI